MRCYLVMPQHRPLYTKSGYQCFDTVAMHAVVRNRVIYGQHSTCGSRSRFSKHILVH